MSSRPAVSIVVPTFNRAAMLPAAIDSALAQTVPCEVIVADHGSADDTPAVVAGYGDRVVYLRRPQDRGPLLAWMDGLTRASADLVHLTYDDDWIEPTFVEQCLAVLADDCGFAFTAVAVHYEDGRDEVLNDGLYSTGTHACASLEHLLLDQDLPISPGCGLFRRTDALRAMHPAGLPLGGAEYRGVGPDLLMYLLPMLHNPRFGFVDRRLAHFRAHATSLTVEACATPARYASMKTAYDAYKQHYLVLRHAARAGLGPRLLRRRRLRRAMQRALGAVAQRPRSAG